jgi:D-serine dehydratase
MNTIRFPDNPPALLEKGTGAAADTNGSNVSNNSGAAAHRAVPAWNLLREDLSLPAAVLYAERIEHNLRWMQQFVERYRLKLAPHGKTTMAPRLFQRQLEAGAWGITLATATQAHAAWRGGVRRILLANQLVGRRNMAIVAGLLADPTVEFFCCVDSVAGVDQLGRFFRATGRRLNVLLELGVAGGRTGVRDAVQEQAVLAAVAAWPDCLALAGIELYEGVLTTEDGVRALLQRAVALTDRLLAQAAFGRSPAILTGAGSAWYDVVAEEFSRSGSSADRLELVLRPGCYLTHDIGIYKKAQTEIFARNPIARQMGEGLLPALQLWAYVQSIPEPRRAILGLGKRDCSFDSGFPEPARHFRPGWSAPRPVEASEGWEVTGLMDQHGYLQIGAGDDIQVGDMIAFDISHPCLTFDKWRQVLVVDAAFQVTEVIDTCF